MQVQSLCLDFTRLPGSSLAHRHTRLIADVATKNDWLASVADNQFTIAALVASPSLNTESFLQFFSEPVWAMPRSPANYHHSQCERDPGANRLLRLDAFAPCCSCRFQALGPRY